MSDSIAAFLGPKRAPEPASLPQPIIQVDRRASLGALQKEIRDLRKELSSSRDEVKQLENDLETSRTSGGAREPASVSDHLFLVASHLKQALQMLVNLPTKGSQQSRKYKNKKTSGSSQLTVPYDEWVRRCY